MSPFSGIGDHHDPADNSVNLCHCEHLKCHKYILLSELQQCSGTPMNTMLQSGFVSSFS
jgi:hypothetical protein